MAFTLNALKWLAIACGGVVLLILLILGTIIVAAACRIAAAQCRKRKFEKEIRGRWHDE